MEASINERVLEGRKYGLIWFGAAISLAETLVISLVNSLVAAVVLVETQQPRVKGVIYNMQ